MSLARVVYTTIDDFLRGDVPVIFRKRRFLAMLEEYKRVVFNCSGKQLNWKPRIYRNRTQGITDGTTVAFPQVNRHTEATLPYRGYVLSESITKMERLMNRGAPAIIKIYMDLTRMMLEDFRDDLCPNLINVDGNAAGSTLKMHGLESFLSQSGSVTNGIAVNNDTYAGLATALAGLGGSWTGTWPAGYGDSEYDAWSPLNLDYNDTAWTGTATWVSDCVNVLRFGITSAQRNAEHLDTILLERSLYNDLLNTVDANERIMVSRAPESSRMVRMGFHDVINIDGTDVSWEDGLTANTGYGVTWDRMELCSMQSQLIVTEKDVDLPSFSSRFALDCYGNLRVDSPKYFLKIQSI